MANLGELTEALQNKSLSDDLNPLMELQGIPWLVRKAASMVTIKARLTQHTGPDGVASLTTEGMSAGGLKAKATTYRRATTSVLKYGKTQTKLAARNSRLTIVAGGNDENGKAGGGGKKASPASSAKSLKVAKRAPLSAKGSKVVKARKSTGSLASPSSRKGLDLARSAAKIRVVPPSVTKREAGAVEPA